MIGRLLVRATGKLKRLWFTWVWAPALATCGSNSFLYPPYRIDGAKFIHIGKNSVIQAGGWLYCVPEAEGSARLEIGSGCELGYNNHITAVRDVVIEDDVLTANNVFISDNQHAYEDTGMPILHQPVRFKNRVVIGRGSWLGENVCVVGASVGRNSVIGANAVVTCDIPDYCVAVGTPARVIRRFDPVTGAWVNTDLSESDK